MRMPLEMSWGELMAVTLCAPGEVLVRVARLALLISVRAREKPIHTCSVDLLQMPVEGGDMWACYG